MKYLLKLMNTTRKQEFKLNYFLKMHFRLLYTNS